MGLHQRTRIRQAIKAALTGLVSTSARVYTSRVDPVPTDQLPALRIETNGEVSDDLDLSQHAQQRTLQLVVIGMAKATASLDDVLDQIALEVEGGIFNAPDQTFGGIVETINYQGAQVVPAEGLEQPVGEIRLNFFVIYHALTGAPDTPL